MKLLAFFIISNFPRAYGGATQRELLRQMKLSTDAGGLQAQNIFPVTTAAPTTAAPTTAAPTTAAPTTAAPTTAGPIKEDGDDGPWYKILENKFANYQPSSDKVGTLSPGREAKGFAKLSDAEIQQLAGEKYYLRFVTPDDKNNVYLEASGVSFVDTEPGMGYSWYGKKENNVRITTGSDFISAKSSFRGLPGGNVDTWSSNGKTGDDDATRWFMDMNGKIDAFGKDDEKDRRSFQRGNSVKYQQRTGVTIWVKPRKQ